MADIEITYNNSTIASLSDSGTEILDTAETFMADDITISYTKPAAPSPSLQAKTNIAPATSSQTITPDSGYDGLSSVQINAMPTGTAGTPTATKGTVSNHAVSVTPSVTNTTGYITGSTKTGTAVSVSASELVSGTLSITDNGTADVTNYASVNVNVGGGGTSSSLSDPIRFFDYDGTLVASYTSVPSALPANPSHSGLIAQGWNYTLAQIQTQFNATGSCDIGQMYITQSGKTEIDIELQEGRLEPYLGLAVNGSVVVDWGDNSTSTITGTSLTTQIRTLHTYSSAGSYTITIATASGSSFTFYGTNTYYLLSKNNSTAVMNYAYANYVKAVRVGNGITSIGNYAFYSCRSLACITVPNGVTSIGTYAFQNCYSLKSIVLPSGVTSIGNYAFQSCYSLTSISLPSSATNVGLYLFQNGYSLKSIVLPSGVTSIGTYAFQSCYSLTSVALPSGVTSIEAYAFQSCSSLTSVTIPNNVVTISDRVFYYCTALTSITIPSGVTSIKAYAFYYCTGMGEYHLKPTTPPTLANTNAFSNIPSDCIIYVPQGSLSAYQTATNWSTYASYMQEEPT